MLKEHKVALAAEEDLQAITKLLEKDECERHQERQREIQRSAAEAQLFYSCLHDHNAGEAGVVARSYLKVWAVSYGVDLDEVRQRKEQRQQIVRELIATDDETKEGSKA